MAFTLTLLGTGTQFSPGPMPNAYDKAETLSYVSTLIQGDAPYLDPKSEVKYKTNNVAVVDGPTTFGPEVGDRIAHGVFSILKAISRGETDINIIAHSRGAVEAILVAHEIERIQTLMSGAEFDPAQLSRSACTYTAGAMNGAHQENFASLNLNAISQNIGKVGISMLNIDPVPGGNYLGITHVTYLAWDDNRFYTVPKIVKEYEQYIYENERTRCFKPIVPKCESQNTKFKLLSLPGHHGTGSGNLLSQQRELVPNGKKTDHVQELMIVKIIDFLTRNGVILNPIPKEADPFVYLVNKLFEKQEGQSTHQFKPEKLSALYLELYNSIVENIEAYRHFNKTSYGIGQEQALYKFFLFWKVIIDDRIVHHQAHNDTYLGSILPPVPGGRLLNYEHARLHLNHILNLENGRTLSETIHHAFTQSITLCTNDTVPEILMEGLELIISEVKESYLQGKFIDPEERTKVYEAINEGFKEFNIFIQANPDNRVAKTVLDTLNQNIEKTLRTKYHTLDTHYAALSAKLTSNEFFIDLQNGLAKLRAELVKADGNEIKNLLITKLDDVLSLAKDHNDNSVENIRGFIQLILTQLVDDFPKENMEKEEVKPFKDTIACMFLMLNDSLENSLDYDVENLMREVLTSYHDLDAFRAALPDFKQLHEHFDYNKLAQDLELRRSHMVYLAGQYVANNKINLGEIKPIFNADKRPYEQIAGIAISFGAENPLEATLDKNAAKIQTLKKSLKNSQKEKDERISTLEKQNEKLINDETEFRCLQILRQKLVPLTQKYLQHLVTEVIKSVAPEYKETDLNASISYIQEIQDWPENEAIKTLQQKFIKVCEMYEGITNKKGLPSEKIVNFYKQLNLKETHELLETHRDSKARRYVTNILAVFAIVATGILPGLLALALASKIQGKPVSMKFWVTEGQGFFQATKETETEKRELSPKLGRRNSF